MGLTVYWTDTATQQLKDIFDYYLEVANYSVASKISKSINRRAKSLSNHPLMGPPELSLAYRKIEYRYLIEGNYKIIYWLDGQFVKIASVFDCRQDPEKILLIE